MRTQVRKSISLVISLLLIGGCQLQSEILYGICTKVTDGDTITIREADKTPQCVRLWGIDAPEKRQTHGEQARQLLFSLVSGKALRIETLGVDRHGRHLGKVYQGDLYVNREMVQQGGAWHYTKYAPQDTGLAEAEKQARTKHTGLWSTTQPTPPWKWRRAQAQARRITPPPLSHPTLYWVSRNGKIHTPACRYYGSSTKGHFTTTPQGQNCRICGGTNSHSPRIRILL